jgi:hypothetical protein
MERIAVIRAVVVIVYIRNLREIWPNHNLASDCSFVDLLR